MDLSKLYPSYWLKHEDGGKALAVRRDLSPRESFHWEVDRMFDDFFSSFARAGVEDMLKPSLDLSASDKEYTVSVELPGVDEKDVAVEVDGNTLIISGEKKHEFENKDEKKGVYHMERSYGSFRRTLALPDDANGEGGTASFEKGVLRLSIPRTAARETRKIEINKG